MRGDEALHRLVHEYPDAERVLDIGSGDGEQAGILRASGREVTTVSLKEPADIIGDYMLQAFPHPFDAIWACHVIEHQPNVGRFLTKCRGDLCEDGVFAVTVPPMKQAIVGGHLTVWNAGLLLYNLVVAGFDCAEARVGLYGYNISVIIRKREAKLPELACDKGDIERLARFFPVPAHQGFDGRIGDLRW